MAAAQAQQLQVEPTAIEQLDRKASIELVEKAGVQEVDNGPRIELTDEENRRLRRKIDKRILPVLFWVYLLQILDKFVFGYGNIYGMSTELGLAGTQYSLAATMNNIAQLAWMPFSTYLIVKVPARILMPALVFGWGASQACMAASNGLAALAATRFLLGLFEAGCLPLFSIITAHWYRRSEQPFRVALWYCTVGFGQITAAVLSFALGKVNSPVVSSWRLIFIVVGIITVITAPCLWFVLDSDIMSSRFLTDEEKEKCVERVRANQTGTGSTEFKWPHIWELVYDPKTYLFGGLSLCVNFGATVATAFGPTLIRDLGFSREEAALLNAPFGGLQTLTILVGSYLAQRLKKKGICLIIMMTPVLIGTILLYVGNVRAERDTKLALAGYYCLAPLWSANPLIVSWMISNTGGQTKKSGVLSLFNAFNAAGSIVGPLLFSSNDAPRYLPGIRATLGILCAFMGCNVICFGMIFLLNKQRARQRVAVGKPAQIKDTSMLTTYETYGQESHGLGEFADKDVTDFANNEFQYVY